MLDEIEDPALRGSVRQVEDDVQEEAVEFGLGQRIGALLLDRVFRRQHQEGVRKGIGDAVGADLPLGHGLEECRLHLRRRPVDLVDEDDGVEDRPRHELEGAAAGPPDGVPVMSAGIRSGVHWMRQGDAETVGEALRGAGLGQARQALDQEMAVGKQPDQQAQDQGLAVDEAAREVFAERREPVEDRGIVGAALLSPGFGLADRLPSRRAFRSGRVRRAAPDAGVPAS